MGAGQGHGALLTRTAPRRAVVATLLAALALLVPGCGGSASGPAPSPSGTPTPPVGGACVPVAGTPALTLRRVTSGLRQPVDLQAAPGDRTRLFVVEQAGRLRVLRNGALLERPFLDISARVLAGGERGLLGLAFHPRYAQNGRFFVNYTDARGDTRLAEFRVTSGDPELADPASERLVLQVTQPFANHNGGGLAFGPDGFLYAALGDGGSGGDPQGNGQNLSTLLGKLLRLDVDGATPYAVPASNPFVGRPGVRPELWAYGLRNPWRFAFDRATGDLYIGDVGQGALEEIDFAPANQGGQNYGWNVMEGSRCFQPASGCDLRGLTLPVYEYGHGEGCSVTGGVVYRGCRLPGYSGTYFFGDYCTGFVRSFRVQNGRALDVRTWTPGIGTGLGNVSAFGTDADGEVYVLDHDGDVFVLEPQG